MVCIHSAVESHLWRAWQPRGWFCPIQPRNLCQPAGQFLPDLLPLARSRWPWYAEGRTPSSSFRKSRLKLECIWSRRSANWLKENVFSAIKTDNLEIVKNIWIISTWTLTYNFNMNKKVQWLYRLFSLNYLCKLLVQAPEDLDNTKGGRSNRIRKVTTRWRHCAHNGHGSISLGVAETRHTAWNEYVLTCY